MHELAEGQDWFYFELRWWLKRHPSIAPILVTSTDFGVRYIPELIRAHWPNAQVTRVDPRALDPEGHYPKNPTVELVREASIRSILGGIASSAGDTHISLDPEPFQRPGRLSIPGVFAWEKDLNFRYVNVNENYARAAGYDSPDAMIGKTDEQMPWRSLVNLFRAGDQEVMSGKESLRECVLEKEVMIDRVADILVNESPLRDRRGEIVGLTGCFLDISGLELKARTPHPVIGEDGLSLGKEFGDERLSRVEIEVFRGLVRSLALERIADKLEITHDEVKAHVAQLKSKLQGATEGDVIATAVRAGLPLLLFGPIIGEG
jgi:DNA-binding CsgD family transcriptional regulator